MTDNPVIIAEKSTKILNLSVKEAVMTVVYYRRDGNISWIDSE